MGKLFTVSAPPHVRAADTTTGIMMSVLIALIPAQVAAVWIFGARTLLVTAVCVAAALLSEWLIRLLFKRTATLGDLSAVVTGVLLAFCLPPNVPLWMGAIGSVFAIVVAKQFFGGIGQNFVNPAIAGRIFLLLSFPTVLMTWALPEAQQTADAVTGATPLAIARADGNVPSLWDLFLGQHGGSYGEVCVAALLLGGAYLLFRKVISPIIPLSFIGTVAVGMFLAGGLDWHNALEQILSGGVILGAVFMATDYVTSPMYKGGKLLFGIGCGLVTVAIRAWGNMPEGVSYAILLMNILTPLIERITQPKIFGARQKTKEEAAA
ncbi:MAG: RnfABCDGE type electron transport complex subunit D [Oscillospiraceae bacterium]|jgi:electron transport complex protein RnfD|nr:RnfABCDGE type electron transport complex subunit D [Oscillospiraceae bacterium]